MMYKDFEDSLCRGRKVWKEKRDDLLYRLYLVHNVPHLELAKIFEIKARTVKEIIK